MVEYKRNHDADVEAPMHIDCDPGFDIIIAYKRSADSTARSRGLEAAREQMLARMPAAGIEWEGPVDGLRNTKLIRLRMARQDDMAALAERVAMKKRLKAGEPACQSSASFCLQSIVCQAVQHKQGHSLNGHL